MKRPDHLKTVSEFYRRTKLPDSLASIAIIPGLGYDSLQLPLVNCRMGRVPASFEVQERHQDAQ